MLKKIRADVGAKQDETTLTGEQFETALQNLKTIFEDNFLYNKDLAHDLHRKRTDPKAFSRKEKKQINDDFRETFFAWLKSLIGHRAFAFASSGMEFLIFLICGSQHRLYARR